MRNRKKQPFGVDDHHLSITKKEALIIMRDFFTCQTAKQSKDELWNWLQMAIESSAADFIEGRERSDMLFMYWQLCMLLNAAQSLVEQTIALPKNINPN